MFLRSDGWAFASGCNGDDRSDIPALEPGAGYIQVSAGFGHVTVFVGPWATTRPPFSALSGTNPSVSSGVVADIASPYDAASRRVRLRGVDADPHDPSDLDDEEDARYGRCGGR